MKRLTWRHMLNITELNIDMKSCRGCFIHNKRYFVLYFINDTSIDPSINYHLINEMIFSYLFPIKKIIIIIWHFVFHNTSVWSPSTTKDCCGCPYTLKRLQKLDEDFSMHKSMFRLWAQWLSIKCCDLEEAGCYYLTWSKKFIQYDY